MIYFDDFGLLTTKEKDGGDALHRESFARFTEKLFGSQLFGLKSSDSEFVSDCYLGEGIWRRHLDKLKWYSDPATTTRDQYVPLICWLLMTDQVALLAEIKIMLKERNWFFPNTVKGWGDGPKKWWKGEFPDFITPEIKNLLDPSTVMTYFGCKALTINSMIKAGKLPGFELGRGITWGDPTSCDDTGHIAMMMTYKKLGYDVSEAIRIYSNEALYPPGDWGPHRITARLRYWFRDEWGSNPGFADAMRPMVEQFFWDQGTSFTLS